MLNMGKKTSFLLVLFAVHCSVKAWIPKKVARVSAEPLIPPPPVGRPMSSFINKPYQQYSQQSQIITSNFSPVPKYQESIRNDESQIATYNIQSSISKVPISSYQIQVPVSNSQDQVRNPRIPLFGYQVPKIPPFGCYRGERGKYSKCKCENCIVGITCMCLKAKNIPGRGDVLDCHTASESNSLVKTYSNSMTEFCFTSKYQGYMTSICYCNTPFCNAAPSCNSWSTLSLISAFFIICKELIFYL